MITENTITLDEFIYREECRGRSIEGKEKLTKHRDELESSDGNITSILKRTYDSLNYAIENSDEKIKKIVCADEQNFVDNFPLDTNKVFSFVQEKWIGIYNISEKTFVIQRYSFK